MAAGSLGPPVERLLLINPRSGDPHPSAEELARAARERGVEARLLHPGDDPVDVVRRSGASVVGIAGGDGSLAAVAAAALETGAAFVCIPFGTRNHFARDLGLDRNDPLGALAAFDGRAERRVDAGRVGDRLFLNNVSLGTYARLVHRRERHRRRGEALARARALLRTARHRHRLQARVNGEEVVARVLLVGNNRYELDLFTLGARERLDAGELCLWSADGVLPHRWEERTSATFRIEVDAPHVRAAIDGEPAVLEPPLRLESVPHALRVLLPGQEDGGGGFATRGEAVHDNPRATETEQEQAHEGGRQQEEEAMRYPEHDDPDEQRERSGAEEE
jgi:diacylglycerol kinase family enzyme